MNWCQQEEDDVLSYHIDHLKSYKLDDPEDTKNFRDTIHSIFDWGLGCGRVQEIQESAWVVEWKENGEIGS